MLLAEQASKQGCFISLHTLSREFISCVILPEALQWLSRTLAEMSASCFVNVISAPFPLFLGWLLWVLLYVLLLNLREICFMKKTWIWGFKGFLAVDRNGWFALRSASSHGESELKQTGWNKGWFFPCAGITPGLTATVCCSAAGLQHCSWAICSSGPVAVREPW